jgi:hypothetical protein
MLSQQLVDFLGESRNLTWNKPAMQGDGDNYEAVPKKHERNKSH